MILSYFVEGKQAYRDGKQPDDNQYPPDSEAFRSWRSGWDHEWFNDSPFKGSDR